MATLGTLLHTWLSGTHVGTDSFGNRYFEAKKAGPDGIKRRWVLYEGDPEPTKIPAHWHGWMHYNNDEIPDEESALRYSWQKPSRPNATGTPERYLPGGHLLRGGKRQLTKNADYVPWEPKA